MPGIFDDDELDALEGDSSNPEEHDDPQGPRGDGPDADASESGGDPVAELKRKLAEERGTNEELMVRLARVEGMLAGTSAKPADPEKETKFSVESLAEHAAGGGKEAFEAAVAYLKQEEGNFRERILKELKGNQAQEDTRSELEAMLPGISNPRSAAFKAVEVEQAKILSRRPSLDTNRAWDLAVVAVARTQGAGAAGPAYSRDRRANTSAASGAASGGDRDPGAKQTFEFTNEDEAVLRRMKPDSRVFSKDPKVRAAARRTFVKLKANIASRSQSASYTRNRSNGG
jgi:hypothetical protein